jgi:hypothetical protein
VEGVNEEVGSASGLPKRKMEQQQGAAMVGVCSVHGGHVQDTRLPLGHFTEYVAGDNVAGVGAAFGLLPG